MKAYPLKSSLSMAVQSVMILIAAGSCVVGHSADQAPTLPTIQIQAEQEAKIVAKKTSVATKTETLLSETPQSISVVTREEMDKRGVQNLNDVVTYTAGVQVESAGIDSRVDDVTIRGYDVGSWSNNRYIDGTRSPTGGQWTVTQFDPFGLESVEVVKGPSAVLYGQVAPGGLLNATTKKPMLNQKQQVGLQFSSYDQYRGDFDLGGSLSNDDSVLYRVVGLARDGDSQIDHTKLGRYFFAPSLSWQLADQTKLTLLAQYQKDFGGSTFQFMPKTGVRVAGENGQKIDNHQFIGEPTWNVFDREQITVGYIFEHAFNDVFSFRQNARYFKNESLYRTAVTSGDAKPDGTQNRRAVQGKGDADSIAIDNQFSLKLNTGVVEHTVLAGLDYFKNNYTHYRDLVRDPKNPALVAPINIYHPKYTGTVGWATHLMPQIYTDANMKQLGLYVQDQVKLERFYLTLGARHDRFDNEETDLVSKVSDKNKENATTYRLGALYKFDNGFAPYISYAESFEPVSATNVRTDANDNILSTELLNNPTTGKQIELGLKYQPNAIDGMISLAVFNLDQQNLLTSIPNDTACGGEPCQRQSGEVRTRGVELEGKLNLTDELSVIASLTKLDTKVTKDANFQGKELTLRPDYMANTWVDYTLKSGALAGLGFGVGVRYVGDAWYDDANTEKVEAYTLMDAALRYDLQYIGYKGFNFTLNATNVTDKLYITNGAYGSARNITGRLTYHW